VAEFAPDIIHSNHLWMASAVARQVVPHTPLVTTSHGTSLRQHSLCPELGQSLRRRCGASIASSPFSGDNGRTSRISWASIGYGPCRQRRLQPGMLFRGRGEHGRGHRAPPLRGQARLAKGVPWLLKTLRRVPGHLAYPSGGSGSGRKRMHA
jgi:hypothetical protein